MWLLVGKELRDSRLWQRPDARAWFTQVLAHKSKFALLFVLWDCHWMIGLFYSSWSYWIRQSQSDKTVFALGRSHLQLSMKDKYEEQGWDNAKTRFWRFCQFVSGGIAEKSISQPRDRRCPPQFHSPLSRKVGKWRLETRQVRHKCASSHQNLTSGNFWHLLSLLVVYRGV